MFNVLRFDSKLVRLKAYKPFERLRSQWEF